jgi:hypothetical protein
VYATQQDCRRCFDFRIVVEENALLHIEIVISVDILSKFADKIMKRVLWSYAYQQKDKEMMSLK